MKFAWDPKKAASNLRKHKVSFREAGSAFADPLADTFDDPDHSIGEHRFILIGHSNRGKLLFISFTHDEDNTITIISARSVTRVERKQYEEIED